MIWNVKRFNTHKQVIEDFNPLRYYDDWIKKQKKKCGTKAEFSEVLDKEMLWRFWSKCEWELVIEITNDNRVLLRPWVGCYDKEKATIDVTYDTSFDWQKFAKYHINMQGYDHEAKIDVYDQLQWNWNKLVDYLWHTRLKWERDHIKFHTN